MFCVNYCAVSVYLPTKPMENTEPAPQIKGAQSNWFLLAVLKSICFLFGEADTICAGDAFEGELSDFPADEYLGWETRPAIPEVIPYAEYAEEEVALPEPAA